MDQGWRDRTRVRHHAGDDANLPKPAVAGPRLDSFVPAAAWGSGCSAERASDSKTAGTCLLKGYNDCLPEGYTTLSLGTCGVTTQAHPVNQHGLAGEGSWVWVFSAGRPSRG